MLVILAAALLPALVLMWYVYNKDTQPEPTRLIVKGFFYGGLATFVSTLISGPLMAMGFFTAEPHTFAECMTTSFFGAAIPEECAKLLMLWLLLRHNPEFDERYDGIVIKLQHGAKRSAGNCGVVENHAVFPQMALVVDRHIGGENGSVHGGGAEQDYPRTRGKRSGDPA